MTTAWALIELLRNPDSLARYRAEIDHVFSGGKPVSHALLRELDFTENIVKETLRLHPPLFMLVRVAKKDFVYKEYFIPAGSWVLVSPQVAHMIPEIFSEPERFDPDRFAAPREEDKRDFAFIAFGGGRHKCLGNAFAILQVKAILAMLLGQYEFELGGDEVAPDFHGLVIGPKEPCRIRYRRRKDASVTIAHATELVRTANELGRRSRTREAAGIARGGSGRCGRGLSRTRARREARGGLPRTARSSGSAGTGRGERARRAASHTQGEEVAHHRARHRSMSGPRGVRRRVRRGLLSRHRRQGRGEDPHAEHRTQRSGA